MIKSLVKYLYKKRGFVRPPNELSSVWHWRGSGATHDQRLLMRYGLARTPSDAQHIMDKGGHKSAWEIIDKMPRPKKRDVRARLVALIRRYDGHDARDPYKDNRHDDEVKITYKFK